MITEANTKVRIRDKAKELFLRYGIRSVSMDDIANQLGMSKKTIYQYFTDKNELVDAVVEGERGTVSPAAPEETTSEAAPEKPAPTPAPAPAEAQPKK